MTEGTEESLPQELPGLNRGIIQRAMWERKLTSNEQKSMGRYSAEIRADDSEKGLFNSSILVYRVAHPF